MTASAVRQIPGRHPNHQQAVCDKCGWRGPARDQATALGRLAADLDRQHHDCSERSRPK